MIVIVVWCSEHPDCCVPRLDTANIAPTVKVRQAINKKSAVLPNGASVEATVNGVDKGSEAVVAIAPLSTAKESNLF